MAFERQHRLGARYARRRAQSDGTAARNVYRHEGRPIRVVDNTGVEVFRIGTYGVDQGNLDNRGIQVQDSTGSSIGEISGSTGVSFGNPSIGTVVSDSIVQVGQGTKQLFIDFGTNASPNDTYDLVNDGLAPIAYTEGFTGVAGTAWDARVADDGVHKWNLLQGTTANITAGAGVGKMVLAASDSADMSAQVGGMFEEINCSFQWDKVPTAAAAQVFIWFRMLNKGTWASNQQGVRFRVQVPAGGGVPTQIAQESVDGTSTGVGAAVAAADAATFVANTNWFFRGQVYYNYLTQTSTYRCKIWKNGSAEPSTWTYSQTSTNDAILQRGGSIGLGMSTGAIGNPNITCQWTSFSYKLLDPDLIASDDSSATAGALDYTTTGHGPFQTLSQALRSVSPYNAAKVFINWHNGNQNPIEPNTHIDGFVGSGEIYLISGGPTINGALSLNGNSCFIHLGGLQFTDTGGGLGYDAGGTILVNTSRHVEIFDCRIQTNSNSSDNVRFIQGSEGSVYRSQLNGSTSACVRAMEGSVVKCVSNAGTGGTNTYIAQSSIIFMSNQAPTSAGGNSTTTSGQIFNAGAGPAPASTGAGSAPPTTTKVTKSWSANGSGTYGMAYGTWASGDVVQGQYAGSQNHKGLWHYPASLQSTLSGKTINAGYITIRRANNGGSSSAQNIYLACFDTNSVSSGDPGAPVGGTIQNLGSLAWGQTKTFKVSNTILGYLQTAVAGGSRCLGIFQADGNPYVILTGTNNFSGSGKLKITYT